MPSTIAACSTLGGDWAAVWRPGKGPLHWVSALPTDFENFDAAQFAKGRRLITAGEWDAGGLDFDLGTFLKSLFKGTTVSDGGNSGGDDGGDGGDSGE